MLEYGASVSLYNIQGSCWDADFCNFCAGILGFASILFIMSNFLQIECGLSPVLDVLVMLNMC